LNFVRHRIDHIRKNYQSLCNCYKMTIDLPLCTEEVDETLQKIFKNEKLKDPKVTFDAGSKLGEGFLAINAAVDVSDDNRKLHLFVKAAPKHLKLREISATEVAYTNELKFYEQIYPKIEQFYYEKTKESLEFAPKFYSGTNEHMKEILVMENLKRNGFQLNGVRNIFNEEQLIRIMEKYGEFHGTSFALKDQKEEIVDDLTNDIKHFVYMLFKSMGLSYIVKYRCNFLEKYLQAVEDAKVLEKVRFLKENLDKILENIKDFKGDYRTILHGDCWSNNIMLRKNKENQWDIRLIDFQGTCLN
ncbi:phosphotransferase, partial [Oryctes borbonicus]